jgi:putative aminopeptidase FrvX
MPANRATRFSMLDTLRALVEADGPPGREGTLRRLAARHLPLSMRHVRTSPLGSLYAERTSARGVRLMLTAPLDEAGFIVSHVDQNAIAWLHPAGRIDPDSCAGATIRFPDGLLAALGVVSSDAGKRAPARLLADFGSEARVGELRIGSMGVFATPWQAERTSIRGKALESRLGVGLALDVAHRTARAANSLVLALTALGQVEHRAARAAATDLAPAAAIVLGGYPVESKRTVGASSVRPGKGPVILVRSGRFVADPRLVEALRQAAARARVPCQLAVAAEELAGAGAVQSSLDGIATASLLVACEGVGTPRQQVDTRDLEAAAEVLVKLIERPLVL